MNGAAASTREEHDPADPEILSRLYHNAYSEAYPILTAPVEPPLS